jgi:transcriptional regulator of acetoin/glycerol metabolism
MALGQTDLSLVADHRSASLALYQTLCMQRCDQAVPEMLRRILATDATVLITGENGIRKEAIARAIHRDSNRKDARFVSLNCATIPAHLLDIELFGYERGAFIGAVRRKRGKFEYANKGTIFLDEIDDMSLTLQAKLLQVLQSHSFERLGGYDLVTLDVRVLVATNNDLEAAIRASAFREDLYECLKGFHVDLSALGKKAMAHKLTGSMVAVAFSPTIQVEQGDTLYRCYDPHSGRRIILTTQVGAAVDKGRLTGLDGEAMQEVEALIALGMIRISHPQS